MYSVLISPINDIPCQEIQKLALTYSKKPVNIEITSSGTLVAYLTFKHKRNASNAASKLNSAIICGTKICAIETKPEEDDYGSPIEPIDYSKEKEYLNELYNMQKAPYSYRPDSQNSSQRHVPRDNASNSKKINENYLSSSHNKHSDSYLKSYSKRPNSSSYVMSSTKDSLKKEKSSHSSYHHHHSESSDSDSNSAQKHTSHHHHHSHHHSHHSRHD